MVQMRDALNLSIGRQQAFVSIAVLMAAVGSPLGAALADRRGRKVGLGCNAVLFVITALMLAFAKSWGLLIVARAGIGLTVGSAAAITPMYLAECVASDHRGAVVATYNLFVNGGQLIAALIGTAFATNRNGWRFMLGLASIPAAIQFLAVLFVLPESPLWLQQKVHRLELLAQQRAEVQKLNEDEPGSSSSSGGSASGVQSSSSSSSASSASAVSSSSSSPLPAMRMWLQKIRELMASSSTTTNAGVTARHALLIGCFLQFVQQASGVNTVMYYTGPLLADAGFASQNAIRLNSLVASFNFMFAFLGVFLMGRFSRRAVALGSLCGVAYSLLLLVVSFHMKWNLLSVAGLCLYLACFASGMGPAPWTINAEIYPPQFRAAGAAASTTVNWVTNFAVSASFLSLAKATSTAVTFALYALVAFSGLGVLYMYLPETRAIALTHALQESQPQPAPVQQLVTARIRPTAPATPSKPNQEHSTPAKPSAQAAVADV
uniref:Major facilitator superfamily (MFS) profile domain-containing protein n=1 Tax=Erythrolobus madagascarensis TaxID=708628 RepID=A0A7S0XMS0_9RHOD